MALPHGKQRAIAARAGISESFLSDILNGRRTCKAKLAGALVKAALAEGIETTVFDWTYPEASLVLEGKLAPG